MNTIEELLNGKVGGDPEIRHTQKDFIDYWLGEDGTDRNLGDFALLKEILDPEVSAKEINGYIDRVKDRMEELEIPLLAPKDTSNGLNLRPIHSVDGEVYLRIGPNTTRIL